jgi:tetratricopeptide (TPR) repeat protein
MDKVLLALMLIAGILQPAVSAQDKSSGAKTRKGAPTLEELILQKRTKDAVRQAAKSADAAAATSRALMAKADLQVTDRQIKEAEATLAALDQFAAAYAKARKREVVPPELIRGRLLRLEGIKLVDAKEFAKGETVLRQALELSSKANDTVLEAGIHNNLGVALRYLADGSAEKLENAAQEFDTARKMAEEQKDPLRAGSYNFNLGQVLLSQKRAQAALDAFKRSAEQSKQASNAGVEARATLYQAISLGRINAVSLEPLKFFDQAHKMFAALGDDRNAGWSLYLMGDHIAYSLKFKEAASAGERALPFLTRADDKEGLQRCYTFLADMHGRAGNKAAAERYQKLAAELDSEKEKPATDAGKPPKKP